MRIDVTWKLPDRFPKHPLRPAKQQIELLGSRGTLNLVYHQQRCHLPKKEEKRKFDRPWRLAHINNIVLQNPC